MIDSALAAEGAAVSLSFSLIHGPREMYPFGQVATDVDGQKRSKSRSTRPGNGERESDYRGDYGLRGWCSPRSPSGEKRRELNESNNDFFPMEGLLTHDCSPCTRSARLSIRGKAERTFI